MTTALLTTALAAVRDAAHVCAHVQARLDDVRAITKDDRSPVTIADFASQAIVAAVLRDTLGPVVLVAEETSDFLREPVHAAHLAAVVAALRDSGVWPAATDREVLEAIDLGAGGESGDPFSAHARRAGFWTLDPVDGTKGFLRNQQYAVSLAFIDEEGPALGVLGCPNLPPDPAEPIDGTIPSSTGSARGCLFHAIRNEGAFQEQDSPDGAALVAFDIAHPGLEDGDPVRLAESIEGAHSDQSWSARIVRLVSENRAPAVSLRLDSQAKYAVVARAQADLYLRLPTKPGYVERIWDHAAGSLIAREAGCSVTDIDGRDLDFGLGRGLETNRGIVCAPPGLHGLVIETIRSLA